MEGGLTVKELKEQLTDVPDEFLVTRNDSERGRIDVTKVERVWDYHHPELEVLEIH